MFLKVYFCLILEGEGIIACHRFLLLSNLGPGESRMGKLASVMVRLGIREEVLFNNWR